MNKATPTHGLLGALIIAATLAGCAPSQTLSLDPRYIPRQRPDGYADADLAAILRNHVEGGAVRYASLAQDREPLDRYLGLVSVVGPKATPDYFPTAADRIAYYANVYNAFAMRVVLESYPTTSVHRLSMPFEHGYRFRVDGRPMTLGRLRNMMLTESDQDARLLFWLCDAAIGSPGMPAEPLQPATWRDQVGVAVETGLSNSYLVRLDPAQRRIYLWDRLVNYRPAFIALHIRNGGRSTSTLLDALAALGGPQARRQFESAKDYEVLRMAFDRRLNDVPTPPLITSVGG